MSRRTPSPEALEALRDAFRRSPPVIPRDFRTAAALAGVTESEARTSWSRGWVGVESIKVQLADERAIQTQSAALLKVEHIVAGASHNAMSLQAELIQLRPVVHALVTNLVASIGELADLDSAAAVAHLARIARVHKDVAAVSQRAVELRRLVDGEATSIIGVKKIEPEAPVDIEQARATADQLARAVQRAENARLLADGAVIERELVRARKEKADDGSN